MPNPIEKLSSHFGNLLATGPAFVIATVIFLIWALFLPAAEIATNPRLFIVELTGMFIFLHLFLIHRVHNKDIKALHLKLDEIIATLDGANNNLIKAETAPEAVIDELQQAYSDLASAIPHETESINANIAAPTQQKLHE